MAVGGIDAPALEEELKATFGLQLIQALKQKLLTVVHSAIVTFFEHFYDAS